MPYTLHQLRVFETVAQTGSITRAAERLHMSQPAVSIQLKHLQQHFGLPLTEVVGRRLRLTQAGHELHAHVADLDARLRDMEAAMDELRGAVRGRLRCSVVSTGTYFIPYILGAYREAHPGIDFQLQMTNRDTALRHLESDEADMAVVSILPDDLEVESLPIMDNPLVVVASPQLEVPETTAPLPLAALAELPIILREPGSGTRIVMLDLFGRHGLSPRIPYEFDTNEAIKQAVMAGLGVSVISRLSLKNELRHGALREIPVEGFPLTTRWRLIWMKRKRLSPAARSFLAFLEANREAIMTRQFGWVGE